MSLSRHFLFHLSSSFHHLIPIVLVGRTDGTDCSPGGVPPVNQLPGLPESLHAPERCAKTSFLFTGQLYRRAVPHLRRSSNVVRQKHERLPPVCVYVRSVLVVSRPFMKLNVLYVHCSMHS